jgi:hypothetical protein
MYAGDDRGGREQRLHSVADVSCSSGWCERVTFQQQLFGGCQFANRGASRVHERELRDGVHLVKFQRFGAADG